MDNGKAKGVCTNCNVKIEKVEFLDIDIPKISLDKNIDVSRLIIVLTDFILGGSQQSTVLNKLLRNHD